jgi:hypothetical protein
VGEKMIMDLVAFCEANSVLKFYPHTFPITESDELGLVRITPTFRASKAGLATIEISIIIRSTHPSIAEEHAIKLMKAIDKRSSFNIGDTRVVLLEVKNPFPIYLGKDENDRYQYSNDAWLLIEK